jgi:23S rRNA (uracil1939-C5)-methyltransferase
LALAERVRALLAGTSPEGERAGRVVELFAGAGTLTVALVGEATRYEAVERVPEAAEALRENLRERGLEAKVTAGDAEERAISPATRVVILDPPRSGASGACERILQARPRHVIYVSCNPVTLARDLTSLAGGGYELRRLESFELFPQTSHVELVAHLERPS